jgi:hypothetical protein
MLVAAPGPTVADRTEQAGQIWEVPVSEEGVAAAVVLQASMAYLEASMVDLEAAVLDQS